MIERREAGGKHNVRELAKSMVHLTDDKHWIPESAMDESKLYGITVSKAFVKEAREIFETGYQRHLDANDQKEVARKKTLGGMPFKQLLTIAALDGAEPYYKEAGITDDEVRIALVGSASYEIAEMQRTLVGRENEDEIVFGTKWMYFDKSPDQLQKYIAGLEDFRSKLDERQFPDSSPGRRR